MIYEAAVFCLAGKKGYQKRGSSALRSTVSFDKAAEKKEEDKLKASAKILYDWVKVKQSRLRMLLGWQASGGLPYVSATHLMGVQCFLAHGNKYHGNGGKTVCLEEFQNAVLKRHDMEAQGHEYLKDEYYAEDFE